MGVSRFVRHEDPTPQLGKGDFEFFYSGTLQVGDDAKIPVKSKKQDCYIDQLAAQVKGAPAGSDVTVVFYKNGASLGTVTITAGSTAKQLFTTTITRTLVTAGDSTEIAITGAGGATLAVTLSAYMRVCR